MPAAFYPNDRSTDSQTHSRTHSHTHSPKSLDFDLLTAHFHPDSAFRQNTWGVPTCSLALNSFAVCLWRNLTLPAKSLLPPSNTSQIKLQAKSKPLLSFLSITPLFLNCSPLDLYFAPTIIFFHLGLTSFFLTETFLAVSPSHPPRSLSLSLITSFPLPPPSQPLLRPRPLERAVPPTPRRLQMK